MRLLVLCTVVAAALAATAEPARACSCALGDPRTALSRADAAFVGVFVERRDETTFVFRVEQRVKGPLGSTVEVRSAANGAACGLEVRVGDRIGLFLDRERGEWRGSLCGQIAPARLREAARPLPAPDGSGPAALVVGGRFGPARTIALDGRGRTLGYGKGGGDTLMLSTCPGSRHVAEIVWLDGAYTLAVRELRSLRVVRERRLRLGGSTYPGAIRCEDERGSRVLVFAHNLDFPQRSRLLRSSSGRLATIWRGTALYASLGPRVAHLNTGAGGTQLVALDLRARRTARVARLPAFTGPLEPSPDGTRLAGVAYSAPVGRESPPSRLVLVDRGWVRTAPLGGPNVTGDVFWLAGGRLAFFPRGEIDFARAYDNALRVRSRFRGWDARATALVGSTAFGLGYDGRLLAARIPGGPVRVIRRLPSPVTHVLAATSR